MAYDPGEVRCKERCWGADWCPDRRDRVPTACHLEGRMSKKRLRRLDSGCRTSTPCPDACPMAPWTATELPQASARYTEQHVDRRLELRVHVEHAAAATQSVCARSHLVTYAARPRGSMKQADARALRPVRARRSGEPGSGDFLRRRMDGFLTGLRYAGCPLFPATRVGTWQCSGLSRAVAAIAVSTREWACLTPTDAIPDAHYGEGRLRPLRGRALHVPSILPRHGRGRCRGSHQKLISAGLAETRRLSSGAGTRIPNQSLLVRCPT